MDSGDSTPSTSPMSSPSVFSESCSPSNSNRSSISSIAFDSTEKLDLSDDINSLFTSTSLPKLSTRVVEQPFEYIESLPSKGVRDALADALNIWLKVPNQILGQIKQIIRTLHSTSLMLDDFQDSSPLRRGKPSTHMVFGAPQTTNSAMYWIVQATHLAQLLPNPACVQIMTEALSTLFVGQAQDLNTTYTSTCPSVKAYVQMIDSKTGALFDLMLQLMLRHATIQIDHIALRALVQLLGRHFQVRDDFKNLASPEYGQQKGFCEDLDEGKYSLPIIHVLSSGTDNGIIRNLLAARHLSGKLEYEQKLLILDQLDKAGSLKYTESVLQTMYHTIETRLGNLAKELGPNPALSKLCSMLKV